MKRIVTVVSTLSLLAATEFARFKNFPITNVAMAQPAQVSKLSVDQVLADNQLLTKLRVEYGKKQTPPIIALLIKNNPAKEAAFKEAVKSAYNELQKNQNAKKGDPFYDLLRPLVPEKQVREPVKVEVVPEIRGPLTKSTAELLRILEEDGVEKFIKEIGIEKLSPIPTPSLKKDDRAETVLAIFTVLLDQPAYDYLENDFRRNNKAAHATIEGYLNSKRWNIKTGFVAKGMTDKEFQTLTMFFQSYGNSLKKGDAVNKDGKVDINTLTLFAKLYLEKKGITEKAKAELKGDPVSKEVPKVKSGEKPIQKPPEEKAKLPPGDILW